MLCLIQGELDESNTSSSHHFSQNQLMLKNGASTDKEIGLGVSTRKCVQETFLGRRAMVVLSLKAAPAWWCLSYVVPPNT